MKYRVSVGAEGHEARVEVGLPFDAVVGGEDEAVEHRERGTGCAGRGRGAGMGRG